MKNFDFLLFWSYLYYIYFACIAFQCITITISPGYVPTVIFVTWIKNVAHLGEQLILTLSFTFLWV